jgi:integrase
MGYRVVTPHGFRSSFSDWCHEQPTATPMVIEQSLAHATGGRTALAYRRGDLLDKHRRLMDAWAKHCTGPARTTADVVQMVQPAR